MKVRFCSTVLSLALIGSSVSVQATSKEDLLKEQQEVESRLQETEQSQNQTSEKLVLTKQERKEAKVRLDEVNSRLEDLASKIADQQAAVSVAKEELAIVTRAVGQTESKLRTQEKLIGDRLRSVQRDGDVKYIEVLLDAKDFGDLISRFSTVSEIIKQDDGVLQTYQANVKQLTEQRSEQELVLGQLKKEQRKLLILQTRIIAESEVKRTLVVRLNSQVEQLQQEQFTKAEEAAILEDQQRLISRQLEELRAAELRAQRAAAAREAEAAAEAERQAEQEAKAEKEQQEQNQPTSRPPTASEPVTETPSAQSETSEPGTIVKPFLLPVTGYVSSPFGPRNNPLTGKSERHTGLDLVNAKGTLIKAAAGGIVLRAGSATGYGNVVMITHLIDGKVWTTVYGHLDSVSVKAGQTVMPGDIVGKLGSTGWSTGPHLHFEIHRGEWAVGQPNAVDPAPYIL
ncbi:murein hydrolase activator EnvC [Exiguobacterium sp. s166]|uniref:murein hydrolase activator EnvC family protein n=1 Tax=Exiguobacterium sp. s166 TaxID=2751204 RepID=UPI001BEB66F3|nr:M23 family metallopeptidase [Exiguobacterium sp. s166]